MKKALIATALLGVFVTGSAMAADMPVKAPVMKAAPVYSWTGCYIGGGWGYGLWNQDGFLETDPAHVATSASVRSGGRGWFGTVTGGCDYEFSGAAIFGSNLLIGALVDGNWGSLQGNGFTWSSAETEKSWWAVGGRVGLVLAPNLLTYWNGGYTQARFDGFEIVTSGGVDIGNNVPAHTYTGYFLGGGVDYAVPILSGLFWRNEFRWASYRADNISEIVTATGANAGVAFNSKKTVQTVTSSLIWRFNWGSPVSARY